MRQKSLFKPRIKQWYVDMHVLVLQLCGRLQGMADVQPLLKQCHCISFSLRLPLSKVCLSSIEVFLPIYAFRAKLSHDNWVSFAIRLDALLSNYKTIYRPSEDTNYFAWRKYSPVLYISDTNCEKEIRNQRAVPPLSHMAVFKKWHVSTSSFSPVYSTINPSYPLGCYSPGLTNNPVSVANHHGLVVIVTSGEVPRNNSQWFVHLMLRCRSLFLLSNGKVPHPDVIC